MGLKNNNEVSLSLKDKVIILFVEFFVFAGISTLLYNFFLYVIGAESFYPWHFRGFMYLIYFVLFEFFFNQTLCMIIFRVAISNRRKKEFNMPFLKYGLLVFFDRFLFIIIYMYGVMFRVKRNLLLSEKLSGLRWERKKSRYY